MLSGKVPPLEGLEPPTLQLVLELQLELQRLAHDVQRRFALVAVVLAQMGKVDVSGANGCVVRSYQSSAVLLC